MKKHFTKLATLLFTSSMIVTMAACSNVSDTEKDSQATTALTDNVSTTDMFLDMVYVEGASIKGSYSYNSNVFREGEIVNIPDYYISKFEITQELYTKVISGSGLKLNANPYHFKGKNLPAEHITWFDAVYFCNQLSKLSKLDPAYAMKGIVVKDGHIVKAKVTANNAKNGYRLPTETEWEYAARSGKNMDNYLYVGSDTVNDVAWTAANSNQMTHEVGTKQANTLGIYDMSGNVWEYIYDGYGNVIDSEVANYHLIKGSGWWNYINYATVTANMIWTDNDGDGDLGFRVVRNK